MGSRPFDSHNMKLLFLVGLVGLSQGGVSLSTGTSAVVHVVGKRAAEAEALLYKGYYGHGLPFAAGVVATGGPVPVAVGGYRAEAGEGGAVHTVPGLVPAPALL